MTSNNHDLSGFELVESRDIYTAKVDISIYVDSQPIVLPFGSHVVTVDYAPNVTGVFVPLSGKYCLEYFPQFSFGLNFEKWEPPSDFAYAGVEVFTRYSGQYHDVMVKEDGELIYLSNVGFVGKSKLRNDFFEFDIPFSKFEIWLCFGFYKFMSIEVLSKGLEVGAS